MSDKENNLGNENQDIQDINEEAAENQEYSLGELLGDENDESEKIAEMLKNSETLASGAPELDEALAEFVDGGESDGEENETAESEEDALARKLQEEKLVKVRSIKRVSLVGALTVLVLAVGIVAFFMIYNNMTDYVLTYQREVSGKTQTQRVSSHDFKFLLMQEQSFNPVAGAMDYLITIITIEKAADERNIILSAEELEQIKASVDNIKEIIDEEYPELQRVSPEFLEKVYSINYLYLKLMESIHERLESVPFDEAAYALQLEDFINFSQTEYVDAVYIYMILNSEEKANEVKAAIEGGGMTVAEALIEFYYGTEDFALRNGFGSLAELLEAYEFASIDDFIDAYGYDMIALSNLSSFEHDDIRHLVTLNVNQVSNAIELDAESFVLFITESINIPARDEIDSLFRDIYFETQASDIFNDEYDRLYSEIESSVKINQNAIDKIDLDELFGEY